MTRDERQLSPHAARSVGAAICLAGFLLLAALVLVLGPGFPVWAIAVGLAATIALAVGTTALLECRGVRDD